MRRHLTVLLFSTMLAGPALAQATPPATDQPAKPRAQQEQTQPRQQTGKINFMQQQQAGQWSASYLMGATVYNVDNENLGEINDIILDNQGRAMAAVIGVGGFLGIGEKNVAVDFSALDIQMVDDDAEMAGAPAGQARQQSAQRPMPAAKTGDAPANTTGQATPPADRSADARADRDDLELRVVLKVVRDDLDGAPEFKYLEEQQD